jgi:hypothetical protein
LHRTEVARLGAEAEARALGRSPEAIRLAGRAAADQDLQEERLTRFGAAGARAGHREALEVLDENLVKDYKFVLESDFSRPEMSLTTDFYAARAVVDAEESLPMPSGSYRLHLDYLFADPYLKYHNAPGIDDDVPDPVSDADLQTIKTALSNVLPAFAHNALDYPFRQMSPFMATGQTTTARKRVKRLYDFAVAADAAGVVPSPVLVLADKMAAQDGRCITGLGDGLDDMEAQIMGIGRGTPLHIGEYISMTLADYRMEFVMRHGELYPTNAEFPTMVTLLMKQRMLFSLGLRGKFGPFAYAGWPGTNGPQFGAAEVMRRFLHGAENVRLENNPARPAVNFDAYTVDKLIEVLQAGVARGYKDVHGRRFLQPDAKGTRLTFETIKRECVDANYTSVDSVLGPDWLEFETMNALKAPDPSQPTVGLSRYFHPAANGEFDYNIRLTREFWLHELVKYGYIIKVP